MHGYVCRQYTHLGLLSVETWTLKFNSLGVSHNRRTAYALHAECTWRVVRLTSSLWYRFSFINFSGLMLVPCCFSLGSVCCIVIFQILLACVCQRHPRDCRTIHGTKLISFLSLFDSIDSVCVTIFMNEFLLRLAGTRTLIIEIHVSTYVDLNANSTWLHRTLRYYGEVVAFCSFAQWNAHKTNSHLPCVSPFNEWRLDTFRCNTIVFDKWTPRSERARKKLNENINLVFRRILHTPDRARAARAEWAAVGTVLWMSSLQFHHG